MPPKSSKRKAVPSPSPAPTRSTPPRAIKKSRTAATAGLSAANEDSGSDLSSADTTLSERLAELETQNALLRQQLGASEKKFDARQRGKMESVHAAAIRKLENKIGRLMRELDEGGEVGGMRGLEVQKGESKNASIEESAGDVERLEIENVALKEMLQEERIYNKVWQGRANRAITELTDANAKSVTLEQELDDADSALKNMGRSVREKYEEVKKTRREVEKVEERLGNVQNDLTITQTQLGEAHTHIGRLEETIVGLEERIAELKLKLEDEKMKVGDKQRRKEYYKMANDVLVESNEGFEEKVKTLESKLQFEQNAVKDLQVQLRIKMEEAAEEEVTVIGSEERQNGDMYWYECEN